MNFEKHSIEWNRDLWNNHAYIPNNGEGWSEGFGGSDAQWNNIIIPRIRKFLPTKNVLEIACGHGRWTRFLLRASKKYFGFDISKPAIDFCRNSFSFDILNDNAAFYLNSGKDFEGIDSDSIDFIFSFDSLVHANMDAIDGYLLEAERVLKSNGRIFIHHSNMKDYDEKFWAGRDPRPLTGDGGRSPDVNAAAVNLSCLNNNLKVICQEKIPWGEAAGQNNILTDCFSLIGKKNLKEPTILDNFDFLYEMRRSITLSKSYN